MHHKFAILDHAVVMTGSFNWTVQAVKNNQENILFFENPAIANVYLEEFNRLWKEFTTVIDADEAMEKVRLERENKRRKK
jgi:phosphatidylserine/phosphatidylglycerophosphate/cardiolipin synthase-like enzyme